LPAAHHSGVPPFLSLESGSTLPVASSSLTTASCPLPAAHTSGVRSSLSLRSGSTPEGSDNCDISPTLPRASIWISPLASRRLIMISCLRSALCDSGVRSDLIRKLISTFLIANRIFIREISPRFTAYASRI
jgi:hypothetical protein